MTNAFLEIHSSTNVVKNPVLNSIIYMAAAYFSFYYLLPLVLEVSNLLGAVVFSFIIITFSLTILKPMFAVLTPILKLPSSRS